MAIDVEEVLRYAHRESTGGENPPSRPRFEEIAVVPGADGEALRRELENQARGQGDTYVLDLRAADLQNPNSVPGASPALERISAEDRRAVLDGLARNATERRANVVLVADGTRPEEAERFRNAVLGGENPPQYSISVVTAPRDFALAARNRLEHNAAEASGANPNESLTSKEGHDTQLGMFQRYVEGAQSLVAAGRAAMRLTRSGERRSAYRWEPGRAEAGKRLTPAAAFAKEINDRPSTKQSRLIAMITAGLLNSGARTESVRALARKYGHRSGTDGSLPGRGNLKTAARKHAGERSRTPPRRGTGPHGRGRGRGNSPG